ncbi:MAG: hypothetical protein GYB65_17750 [Chloroflexi bacterium]|nr:hypothetical protein [Chloroflexota bacterium]
MSDLLRELIWLGIRTIPPVVLVRVFVRKNMINWSLGLAIIAVGSIASLADTVFDLSPSQTHLVCV